MASRLDFSQIRSLYVGTSSSTQVDTNNLIVVGNVGIGTTGPAEKLTLTSGSSVATARFTNTASGLDFRLGTDGVQSQYTNLVFYSDSGNAQIWKAGSGYGSQGGAASLNIYSSNGPIAFHPNGGASSNAMFLTTTQNVLIGTTTDSGAKLTVNGETRATSFTNAGALGTGSNNARNHFTQLNAGTAGPATGWIAAAFGDASADRIVIGQWTTGAQEAIFGAHTGNLNDWADTNYVSINHNFYSNGSWSSPATMSLRSNGNLLIGTTTDSGPKLNVNGTSYISGAASFGSTIDVNGNVTLTQDTNDLIFQQTNTSTHGIVWKNTSYAKDSASIRPTGNGAWATQGIGFYTGNTGDSTTAPSLRFNIQAAGDSIFYNNVGIGTDSPAQKLSVFGNIYQRTGDYITWNNGDAQIGAVSGYNLTLSTYNGVSAMVERMRITSAGNVGIGSTSPNGKLTVDNGPSNIPTLTLNSLTGGQYYSNINCYDPYHGIILRGIPAAATNYTVTAQDSMSFYEYGSDFRFYKKTSIPSLQLDAQILAGEGRFRGDVVAYYNFSDERLKDDVKPLEGSLDKVLALQGVSYKWNSGERKGQSDIGLIAQQVEKVIPEVVREKTNIDGDTFKSVNYEHLVGVLIESIKELTAKVEQLEAKLK